MSVKKYIDTDPEFNGEIYNGVFSNFEYSNPIIKHYEGVTLAMYQLESECLLKAYENGKLILPEIEGVDEIESIKKISMKHAKEKAIEEIQKVISTKYPDSLDNIFLAKNKNVERTILNKVKLNGYELQAFIFNAFLKNGFTYSLYTYEFAPIGMVESKMPEIIIAKNKNTIYYSGETSYTKGELKNLLNHKRVRICKFIDKGNIWYCFFYTYDSINGNEQSSRENKCHLHYISYKSNLSREHVLNQLKSRTYKLGTMPHIEYINV